MLARVTKKPDTKYVETDRLIDWISQETDGQGQPLRNHIPKPKKEIFPKFIGFCAAGRCYFSLKALTAVVIDENKGLYKDIFGRRVLAVKERFPCFDSYDYQYEKRYYRWFYLIYKNRLTCVYYEDESNVIEVTKDVRLIKERTWKAMVDAGVLQDDILQL